MFLLGSGRRLFGGFAHAVELREHEVPDFDFAAAGRVEEDFAARAANAVGAFAGRAGRPEVIVLAHALNLFGRQFDIVRARCCTPRRRRDRPRRRVLRRNRHPFFAGQEFPGPVDRVALEIIAEAEIAQHLEKRVVIGRAADVVDIAGAEAFLAGRGPGELQLALAQEMVLELVHAGGREQHGGIPARHQHVAGPADAAFGLEEGQIFFADFVGFHEGSYRYGNKQFGRGVINPPVENK